MFDRGGWITRWRGLTAAGAVTLLVIGCGDDDDGPTGPGGGSDGPGDPGSAPTAPESWEGTWRATLTPDGGRGGVVSDVVICDGGTAFDIFGLTGADLGLPAAAESDPTGSGTWTDGAADVVTEVILTEGPCAATQTLTLDLDRTGDVATGTLRRVITFGESCSATDLDLTYTVNADRIDDATPGCFSDEQGGAPAALAGTWLITQLPVDCETGLGTGETPLQAQQVVCEGASPAAFVILDDEPGAVAGSFDITSGLGTWTITSEVDGCTVVSSYAFEFTFAGAGLGGTLTRVDRSTDGGSCPDEVCSEFVVTAARLSPDTPGCRRFIEE